MNTEKRKKKSCGRWGIIYMEHIMWGNKRIGRYMCVCIIIKITNRNEVIGQGSPAAVLLLFLRSIIIEGTQRDGMRRWCVAHNTRHSGASNKTENAPDKKSKNVCDDIKRKRASYDLSFTTWNLLRESASSKKTPILSRPIKTKGIHLGGQSRTQTTSRAFKIHPPLKFSKKQFPQESRNCSSGGWRRTSSRATYTRCISRLHVYIGFIL